MGGAGLNPIWHWVKAGYNLDQSPSYHMADTDRRTTITYIQSSPLVVHHISFLTQVSCPVCNSSEISAPCEDFSIYQTTRVLRLAVIASVTRKLSWGSHSWGRWLHWQGRPSGCSIGGLWRRLSLPPLWRSLACSGWPPCTPGCQPLTSGAVLLQHPWVWQRPRSPHLPPHLPSVWQMYLRRRRRSVHNVNLWGHCYTEKKPGQLLLDAFSEIYAILSQHHCTDSRLNILTY